MAGALVFVLIHRPAIAERARLSAEVAELQDKNTKAAKKVADLPALQAAVDSETKRADSIIRLVGTTVLPDNVLHELSRILTLEGPTMSDAMSKLTSATAPLGVHARGAGGVGVSAERLRAHLDAGTWDHEIPPRRAGV